MTRKCVENGERRKCMWNERTSGNSTAATLRCCAALSRVDKLDFAVEMCGVTGKKGRQLECVCFFILEGWQNRIVVIFTGSRSRQRRKNTIIDSMLF